MFDWQNVSHFSPNLAHVTINHENTEKVPNPWEMTLCGFHSPVLISFTSFIPSTLTMLCAESCLRINITKELWWTFFPSMDGWWIMTNVGASLWKHTAAAYVQSTCFHLGVSKRVQLTLKLQVAGVTWQLLCLPLLPDYASVSQAEQIRKLTQC